MRDPSLMNSIQRRCNKKFREGGYIITCSESESLLIDAMLLVVVTVVLGLLTPVEDDVSVSLLKMQCSHIGWPPKSVETTTTTPRTIDEVSD